MNTRTALLLSLPIPLLAAACNVERNAGNDTTAISVNEQKIDRAIDQAGNVAADVGDDLKNAADKAGPALKNAADDVGDAGKKAADDVGDAAKDAGNSAENGAERARDKAR